MKNKVKYTELILPVAVIVFASVFLVQCINLPKSKDGTLGPGVWPGVACGGMIVLGVVLLIQELLKIKKAKAELAKETEEVAAPEEPWHFPFKTWAIWAIYAIMGISLKKVGFSILMFFYMIAALYVLGERKWWKILLISAVATLIVSVVFINLLSINLPEGKGIIKQINRAINMKNLF